MPNNLGVIKVALGDLKKIQEYMISAKFPV